MNLFESFVPSSEGEWKEKIIADLKGATIESLNWESELGSIDPILFDYSNKYPRVKSKTNQADNSWIIAKTTTCSNAIKANAKILKDLGEGADGLRLKNVNSSELQVILKEVMIDIIHITFEEDTSEEIQSVQAAFEKLAAERSIELTSCNVSFTCDSIFSHIVGQTSEMKVHNGAVVVKGCLFANAGGSIQNQMGLTIAQGHEYLISQMKSGISFENAVNNISFRLAVGNSYFTEIAKLRAFRTLWFNVISEYGNADELYTSITVETTEFYQSNLDVHNNLLRGTTCAMSAIIGGADLLEVQPYDSHLSNGQNDGDRLATNTQLILKEESFFNQVKNASDGSYYIEQLTDIIIEKSWTIFQEIEEKGGFIKFFQSGEMVPRLNSDLKEKIKQFENEELVILGTNKYPNSMEPNSENYRDYVFGDSVIRPYRLALKSF